MFVFTVADEHDSDVRVEDAEEVDTPEAKLGITEIQTHDCSCTHDPGREGHLWMSTVQTHFSSVR